ncbi:MAG: hypothetical protein EXR02_08770 [Rhodospirillales bacterium]|nr:hypothetical protein [Rhodospirillales bacterium]MSP81133.1 hypothetical protein [Rhodospirillales bacterium]
MKIGFMLAVLALAVASAPASADEKIVFKSQTFKDMGEALSGAPGEPIEIEDDLRFPLGTDKRVPAIVVLHTIGSYREGNEGWHAEQFRKAGFATLTYESIRVRKVFDAPTRGLAQLWGSLVADGFNALKALAQHPRIDPSRIAVTGYSTGGEVTRVLAFERLRKAFVADDLRFAAHVAV